MKKKICWQASAKISLIWEGGTKQGGQAGKQAPQPPLPKQWELIAAYRCTESTDHSHSHREANNYSRRSLEPS